MVEKLVCQSCLMPLQKDADFATNADGSCNQEYCIHCYKEGAFTEPNLTLEALLLKVETIMKQMNMTEDKIKIIKEQIGELKRWKK